jgi:hypothetical protein
MQAIAYVHQDPVASGMVDDPALHRWSGHRQVIGRVRKGLVDVDETLLVFGGRRAVARRHFLVVLRKGQQEGWIGAGPGRLPWWRRAAEEDAALRPDRSRPAMDWLGVAVRPQPPRADAAAVVAVVAQLSGLGEPSIGSRHTAQLVRARQLVMLVGVETCGLKVKDLAVAIGRNAGSASRIYGQATSRRREDPAFAALAEQAIAALRARPG